MTDGIGNIKAYMLLIESSDIVNVAADPIGGLKDGGPAELVIIGKGFRQEASLYLACHL